MWVGIFGEGRLLARPRSKSIALCNESDGVYLGEQEHVRARAHVRGSEWSGPSCQSMIYALA